MELKVPFFVPHIDKAEKNLLDEVLEGSDYMAEELEDAFISRTGVNYALATSSGTSALHLALCALDLKRGDKIICSIIAFPSIPEVVRHFDAEPIFIDIDEKDLNIDLDKIEETLKINNSKKLKAIIVNHMGGQTVDLDRLYEIAKHYDVKIIEDASESFGTKYKNQEIGNTGADITVMSFHNHLKRDVSRGGILLTNDEKISKRARLLSSHGMTWHDDEDRTLNYIYDVVDIGCQYNISELDAAYALAKMHKLDDSLKRRLEIANIYKKKLAKVTHLSMFEYNDQHTFDLFIIKIDRNRDSFARELKNEGIETALHYIPFNLLSYYKTKYSLRVNDFPVALKNYQQVLSLPIYHAMSDENVELVCQKILKVSKHYI
jgi:dTDP-4-amino-4,6-dideoxygalactose transaminase